MTWFRSIYRSAVGKKATMAATGLLLFGFVAGHMVGNLKFFLGPAEFQAYADGLRSLGYPLFPHGSLLWIARLALLGAVGLHVHAAATLWREARRARPRDYSRREAVQLDYAARTMRWGGVILLLYVVYHLLHLTSGDAHPDFREHDVYHNVAAGFEVPWVAAVYVAANLVLGFHLYHGLWSLFQSLGWNHPRYNPWRRAFAVAFAVLVAAGFIAVPVAVVAGWVD
jgi:succinate dehydrogenase / fumarate reductase cytochrome b subunit